MATETEGKKAHRMVAAARKYRGDTQAELAAKIREITGDDSWDGNSITAIENGRRAFSVDLLDVFAQAQDMPISWYLGPDPSYTDVTTDGTTGSYEPLAMAA